MKFIHTGDIHYGMNPDSDKPWSKERSLAVKDSLTTIVTECQRRNVDCLFIAGDLFHHQPLVHELKEVNYLFSKIPHIHVVIIAGNHDRIRDNSAVLSFIWSANVSYITSESLKTLYFPEINTEVYGFSYHTVEIRENQLAGIKIPENGRIRILLAHGGDTNHLPYDKNELSHAGFSYCALGHIHKSEVLVPGKIAQCGSPEPLDLTESGRHGFFVGDINPVTKNVTKLEFIPYAKTQYISLVVHVTPSSTNTELLMSITEEINKRGSDNIYRFKIRGLRDPEIEFDLDVLQSRLRIIELIDESEPNYDFTKLFAEHPSDMIGFFIRDLYRPNLTPVEKKALYYGVNALLRTTDERSQK